jgi:hypothetical protein
MFRLSLMIRPQLKIFLFPLTHTHFGKFPIKKIQSADFDRVGQVRGNTLVFNLGLITILKNLFYYHL